MYFKKRVALFVICILMLSTLGCDSRIDETARENMRKEVSNASQEINIITTIFPLADIINNIGGEKVEVTTLLSPGDSPHTFEPSVEQAKKTSEASLLFYIGGGLDDWAVGLARGEGVPKVEVMEYLEEWILEYEPIPLEEEGSINHHHDDHNDCNNHGPFECEKDECFHDNQVCDHSHGPHDPHVWMDPVLVKEIIAPLIYNELKSLSPEDDHYFRKNLESFQEELGQLHQDIEKTVKDFSRRRFISYHSAWNYFAHRYGLEETASIEEFPGKEPSARWLTELVDLAEEKNIEVIFAEPQLSSKAAETIAREIGGKVKILDPLGGENLSGRDGYIELIRFNLEIFREALE